MTAPMLTEDQSAFAATVARMISDHRAAAARPRPDAVAPPFDRPLWTALADGGYLAGVAPGIGDPVLLGLLAEEVGRTLAPVPLLGSVAAAGAALRAAAPGDPLTERVLGGATLAALCLSGPGEEQPVRRLADGRLVGRATGVAGLAHAEQLVVSAVDDAGHEGLYRVDASDPSVRREPQLLDLTRDVGDVTFTQAPAVPYAAGTAGPAVREALLWARLVDAGEAIGAAEQCLALSVAHLTTRVQFGRPIGSFQALQHRCAVIAVANRAALAGVRRAYRAAAAGSAALPLHVAAAHIVARRALRQAAAGVVQLHGGMGFSWEHDAHLYLRRAHGPLGPLGTPVEHLGSLADVLLLAQG